MNTSTRFLTSCAILVAVTVSTPTVWAQLTTFAGLQVQNDDADTHLRFHDPGNACVSMGMDYSDGNKFKIAYGCSLGDAANFVLQPDGNIGIGTTAPQASLDIWKSYSAGTDSLRFSFNDGSAYWMGIQPYVVGGGNVGYKFRTNNVNTTVDALAITGAGNVGIGTTGPTARFHVKAASGQDVPVVVESQTHNAYLSLKNVGGDNSISASDNALYVGGGGVAGPIYFRNAWTINMALTASGNVGIGTANPTQKLSVNGTIRAKEVIIEASPWPDDVFAPGYALPTVEEVAAHIDANGHLPGVPSASTVAEEGVALGEMQKTLLRKVEELTLYVIAQDKRIRELERMVSHQAGDSTSSQP